MREVSCLFVHGTEIVTAVCESFGKTFVSSRENLKSGDIRTRPINPRQAPALLVNCGIDASKVSPHNYRIIREVHVNTVRAALRRGGAAQRSIVKGFRWYEVHQD